MYDYIIVGSGLYGAIFAHEAMKAGKSCLVVERRSHIGGNIYTKEMEGIQVHQYGAHIFHTSNKEVWDYIGQFATFNRYTNCPVAYYKGQMYNMPFNMNTFHKIWGVITPAEAKAKIEEQVKEYGVKEPKNLEEQAISLVGKDIYEILVKGYTEKQWGRRATELPPEITPKKVPEDYVDEAERIMRSLMSQPKKVTTSKIRNLLSLVTDIYNEENIRTEEKLRPESVVKLNLMRVRVAYECGRDNRDDTVKTFVRQTNLLEYLKGISDDRADLIRFAHYMEALVAFHCYFSSKEG